MFSVILLKKLPKSPCVNPVKKNFFNEVQALILTPKGRLIFPLAFFTGFLLLGLYGYLGSFFIEKMHLNPTESGAIISLFGFSCLFTGIWVGKISEKFKRKNMLLLGGLCTLSMPVMLILFPYWIIGCIVTIALGIGYIFIQSTLATCAFGISPKAKGLSSALIGLGLFGGGGLGASFGSYILSFSNFRVLLILFASGIIFFLIAVLTVKTQNLYL